MTPAFTLRAATEADLDAVKACLAETWHATYDPIFGAARVADITSRWHAVEALRRHLETPEAIFLVGLEDAVVAGTASARRVSPGHVSLQWLYVLPRLQGRGYGKRLMDCAIGHFRDARRVTLDVEPRNTRAIGFYERCGFRQIGMEEREHAGSKDMAAVFERLSPGP